MMISQDECMKKGGKTTTHKGTVDAEEARRLIGSAAVQIPADSVETPLGRRPSAKCSRKKHHLEFIGRSCGLRQGWKREEPTPQNCWRSFGPPARGGQFELV
jgi:hypothetical protein